MIPPQIRSMGESYIKKKGKGTAKNTFLPSVPKIHF